VLTARPTAVLLDFYGTLARATNWISVDVVLAEHGVELDDELRSRYWNDGLDGIEHLEHSSNRDAYVAWQQQRILSMLSETDLHPGEYELVLQKLREGNEARVLEAYDEVPEVLASLRAEGLALGICSNWDWDLAEAVEEAGLTDAVDVIVSSAWAGARKPHPRIFEHTLAKVGVPPSEVVFVGDTWGPDVVGPRAAGMTPVYLRRDGHWPDETAPASLVAAASGGSSGERAEPASPGSPADEAIAIAADLRYLLADPLSTQGSTP
jgi:putative hydrolase of the HAD superfamily